jgi:hypothetical protein
MSRALSALFSRHNASHGAARPFPWLLSTLILLLVVLAGLVASTAEPLLIGLMVGLLVAPILLANSRWAVSAMLLLGLTVGVVLSLLGPSFSRLSWGVSLLGFFLFLPVVLNIQNLKTAPPFIFLVILFIIYALLVSILQWPPAGEFVAGIKRYFLPYGLMLNLALVSYTAEDFRRWRLMLVLIAALQLPFAMYEFLVLVPLRGGLNAGSAVTDVVAGTFGANLRGGSPNSVMALFLLVSLAFLLARWKTGLIPLRWIWLSLPVVMIPIGLAEVKISFFMLPLVFMVVFKDEIVRRPVLFVGATITGTAILLAMGYALIEWVMRVPLDHIIKDTLSYNLYNVGYGGLLLNRTTVLSFWWLQQGWHDPIGFLIGHGLGSSHLDENALVAGHMALRWPRHGIGLTAASQLMWDLGAVGFSLYVLILAFAWRTAGRLWMRCRDTRMKADCLAIQASVTLFALMIVYNDNLVVLPGLQVLLAAILGYLAYLHRLHA